MTLLEKGRVLNARNEGYLRQAVTYLAQVLKSLKDDAMDDDDEKDTPTENTPKETKEAATFNQTDTYALLQDALKASSTGYDTYIADIYEDQGYFVYRKGYNGGYYRTDFTVSASGAVTLGTPEQVVRKVTYLTPSVTESRVPDLDGTINLVETALEETEAVQLIEKAVASDGTVLLKLIAPGKGSSGYYPADVLKRDGPKVFRKGLHNFIDHPTPQEEAERPEGSVDRLGSVLVEDAYWRENYIAPNGVDMGPGLYARAQVQPDFRERLNTLAEHIGTSIRAKGRTRMGQIGDYKGPIVEAITSAKSVDYVTLAGAGGKVLTLMESARGVNTMEQNDISQLRETIAQLSANLAAMQEASLRSTSAPALIQERLKGRNVPKAIEDRLLARLPAIAPLTETKNAIDVVAFGEMIENALKDELYHAQQLGIALGVGNIKGLGFGESQPQERDYVKELAAAYQNLGLSESSAKIAAEGR